MMKTYSPYQFTLFRVLFGSYLLVHLLRLIPYGTELFSTQGVLPDPSVNPTYAFFPNILTLIGTPFGVQLFLFALVIFAIAFTLGFSRRLMAFLLWYGWACLFNRDALISNPGLPFVGWLLLACAIVPAGEPWSLSIRRKSQSFGVPSLLFFGAWFIMALGYTLSGIHKLYSPSWLDGSALLHVLNSPLARDYSLRSFFLDYVPTFALKAMTWGVLWFEVAFAPLCLFKRIRPYAFFLMIIFHFGILTLVNFADLTIGMLMIHLFTFDGRWFAGRVTKQAPIVFFDGVCGLCNRFVDFVISEDSNHRIFFAPLQGDTAQKYLSVLDTKKMESVVLWQDGKVYEESDAIIRVMQTMGNVWGLAVIFRLVPRVIRNAVYAFVAKRRYKWFGKKESCRLPTPRERQFFLD